MQLFGNRRGSTPAAFLLCTCVMLYLPVTAQAFGKKTKIRSGPPVVSPSRPIDSRGETVYEVQGPSQENQPVVPGIFVLPSSINIVPPAYPASLKLAHFTATVEGVIAANGDFIDGIVLGNVQPDVSTNALQALARSRFKPGTLNGKPIEIGRAHV